MLVKKINLTLIFYLILLIFSNGCEKYSNTKSTDVKVITKKNIKVDQEASQYLGMLYPLASGSPSGDYIALSNMRQPVSIVKIDYEGKFVDRYGSRGRGPKEIQSARFFGFDIDEHINIYDKTLGMIKKFHKEYDSVSTYQSPVPNGIDITTRNLNQCDDRWVLGISELDYNDDIIGIFDNNFIVKETFGDVDPFLKGHKSILMNTLLSVDCKNNLVYTSHEKLPFIQIYDLKTLSKVGRTDYIPPSFKLSEEFIDVVKDFQEFKEFMINDQSSSIFLTQTEKYILLTFRNETSRYYETRNFNDRNQFLAIYSKEDFQFIKEIKLDGAPLGSTKEGYIITLVNDNPNNFQIRLLEIQDKVPS